MGSEQRLDVRRGVVVLAAGLEKNRLSLSRSVPFSVPLSPLFPARRQPAGIRTAAAIRNLAAQRVAVRCRLMSGGEPLEEADIRLDAHGQHASFIEEVFTRTDTRDFVGSVRCTALGEGLFTGVAVELDTGNRIFTTLPVVPIQR